MTTDNRLAPGQGTTLKALSPGVPDGVRTTVLLPA